MDRMKITLPTFTKTRWFLFSAGLALGVLALLIIRLFTYSPEATHYHANFAVYLNGQRFTFNGAQYYQEVSICTAAHGISIPQQRAHMHDNINSVIHVHDHAVTWGQFFDNIGWTLGPDLIETDDGTLYRTNGNDKLHIILNGNDYTGLNSIQNMIIKDEDRLLVSFGDINQSTLKSEYATVPSTAHHYDVTADPSSCSGAETLSFKDRLHHLF